MVIIIRDPKGKDVVIKYEASKESEDDDVKVFQATEWLTQKLIEDLLEILEHIDEGYEDDEDVDEAIANVLDIAKIYNVTLIIDLIYRWEDKEITTTEFLYILHSNT